MRHAFRVGCLFASMTIAVIACTTDYQKGLDDVNYGGPSALGSQVPPGPSIDETTTTTSGGTGTGQADQPICVTKGGKIATPEGGTCAKSFSKDVLPALLAGGCAAASCHGGAAPTQQPMIDSANVAGTYTSITKFTPRNGKPYVNPCSIDPTASALTANIDSAASETDRGTLMPPGAIGLPAAIPIVKAWLTCGAPNN